MKFRLALGLSIVLVAAGYVLAQIPSSRAASHESRGASPQAASEPAVESATVVDKGVLRVEWARVKDLVARGAYREALLALDTIQRVSPGNPFVSAYRALCERRLEEQERFPQWSAEELTALRQRLGVEAKDQTKAAKRAKVMERQIQQEQARWDKDLEQLKQQAAQSEEATRTRKAQAAQRRKVDAARQRREAPATPSRDAIVAEAIRTKRSGLAPTAPGIPPREERGSTGTDGVPAPAPQAPSTAPDQDVSPFPHRQRQQLVTKSGAAKPAGEALDVELQPVQVAPATPTRPTLGQMRESPEIPEGAIKIFADQLSMSQDRQVASAEGDVYMVFEGGVLTCEKLRVFTDTNDLYAEGQVWLERGNQVFRAELAHYNIDTHKGRFLEGTSYAEPWYQHGMVTEHIAEGVMHTRTGYLTSCALEPPHFRLQGMETTVFNTDKLARGRHVMLFVEELPIAYLPWLTVADRQTPFFLIPGKKKPWEQFALMGYRYDGPGEQGGTLRLDWRRAFGWGVGVDHRIDSDRWGKGLLKLYYNDEPNKRRPPTDLPKGAEGKRYRALWRHHWRVTPETTIVTDLQEFSDQDYRRELLFREEFVDENIPESFVSVVTNDPHYTLSLLARKRLNRFDSVEEVLPEVTMQINSAQIGESQFYVDARGSATNFQTKNANSDEDADTIRVDWFQELSYALNWFAPVLLTPKIGMRQTYYTKDIQGGSEREQGRRDLLSGQFSLGGDASLKLFRLLPVQTDWLGLGLNQLRHVLTPTVTYRYVHQPTVPNDLLNFAAGENPSNEVTFEIENKLQTKRPRDGKLRSVDLGRVVVSLPYTFRGSGNSQGGRFGDWNFDVEMFPWPWMRIESDWSYPSHFVRGTRDEPLTAWNLDMVIVGGKGAPQAEKAHDIQAPSPRVFEPGPQVNQPLLPIGQWYFGLGHRYTANDKTENVVQLDWRVSDKWQISSFHRLTWKEVANGSKRFNNIREVQYTLSRDLHDWLGELVYRVDREFGEELFLTLTLKAYPEMPFELGTSYHEPKIGSQSSPFSPIGVPDPGAPIS